MYTNMDRREKNMGMGAWSIGLLDANIIIVLSYYSADL